MYEYPLHLRQEVLLEKGAAVLAELSRREQSARDYETVWRAKRELLLTSSEAELQRVEEQFDHSAQAANQLDHAHSVMGESVDALAERESSLALKHSRAHDHPRAFLLAGQPGAGKVEMFVPLNLLLGSDGVLINGDEYRRFHNESRRLNSAGVVRETSVFSSAVTERLIDALSSARRHLIIEGTGRTADVPKRTAELLAAKGYTVELAVLAARPERSLTNTLLRYCLMRESGITPRATALSAHDAVVDTLPDNLDSLRAVDAVSRIRVWTTGLTILYDSDYNVTPPSEAARDFWSSPLSPGELSQLRADIDLLRQRVHLLGTEQLLALEALTRRVERAASR